MDRQQWAGPGPSQLASDVMPMCGWPLARQCHLQQPIRGQDWGPLTNQRPVSSLMSLSVSHMAPSSCSHDNDTLAMTWLNNEMSAFWKDKISFVNDGSRGTSRRILPIWIQILLYHHWVGADAEGLSWEPIRSWNKLPTLTSGWNVAGQQKDSTINIFSELWTLLIIHSCNAV